MILVCKILVEDLLTFLSEVSESVTNSTFLVLNCVHIFLDQLTGLCAVLRYSSGGRGAWASVGKRLSPMKPDG